MKTQPKLIRDKIPFLINPHKYQVQSKTLSDSEYKKALKLKLIEESQEVLTADRDCLSEEIADVYEVLDALIKAYNLEPEKIQQIKQEKAEKKGKFEQKIQLISLNQIKPKIEFAENNLIPQAENILAEKVSPSSRRNRSIEC